MRLEYNDRLIKYLETKKFKKVWLDDRSGFWMERKIKHKYLKKCEVIIDELDGEAIIILECEDREGSSSAMFGGNRATLFQSKYTKKNLGQVLDFVNSA